MAYPGMIFFCPAPKWRLFSLEWEEIGDFFRKAERGLFPGKFWVPGEEIRVLENTPPRRRPFPRNPHTNLRRIQPSTERNASRNHRMGLSCVPRTTHSSLTRVTKSYLSALGTTQISSYITKHWTKFLTHQTGNYPVTCFVSKPSRITLVVLSIINTSYQKLPFGSGDYPDKLLYHQALN